jgi:hypothetical protein
VPTSRVHPEQALAVYAEPLAAGKRVLVLADPTGALAERLEQIEATEVVFFGPDDDLDELRGTRFDLALVANLGLFGDGEPLLSWLRRVLGEDGIALICALNRDAADADADSVAFEYYALFDLVAQHFAEVRMVAELPFHGITLAEMGDENDSPAVSVDTQLAEGDRTPAAFVAVASQRAVDLDPYAIIELPAAEAEADVEVEVDEDVARALEEARAALEEEQLRTRALAAHADALQAQAARADELEAKLDSKARQLSALSVEVEQVRASVDAGRVAAAQREELALRADRAERAVAQLEAELGRATEAHSAELGGFERALRERAQAVRTLEAEVMRRERMVRELVSALEEEGVRPPEPTRDGEPSPGARGVRLEGEAPQADDQAVGALVEENARLRQKLDALALELARREGEAQASAWSIAELERRLTSTSTAKLQAEGAPQARQRAEPDTEGAPHARQRAEPYTEGAPHARQRAEPYTEPAPHVESTADLERQLAAALDELDALRRAIVKEHEARVRAESGEELVRARSEIQRQAVLLEQLGQQT